MGPLEENVMSHYNEWGAVIFFIIMFGLLFLFMPFYKRSKQKPRRAYLAFVVAFALEMFGIPFSLYIISWLFGFTLPEGIFWGHTLQNVIGLWGMYIGIFISLTGLLIVISGWAVIYKEYWSKEKGEGKLVTKGIYKHIRHPQYTGFFMITLGMIFQWATLPLLIMWPILFSIYFKLAKKEEKDMLKEFGDQYLMYKKSTGMFFPKIK